MKTTVSVIAIQAFEWKGQNYAPGQSITMTPLDAVVLSKKHKVTLTRRRASAFPPPPEPPPPPPEPPKEKSRRQYRRRDVQAEETTELTPEPLAEPTPEEPETQEESVE